jgi:hypothetical protein
LLLIEERKMVLRFTMTLLAMIVVCDLFAAISTLWQLSW